jgi:hypothetical protein
LTWLLAVTRDAIALAQIRARHQEEKAARERAAAAARYAPGKRRDRAIDEMLGGLWGLYFDLLRLAPKAVHRRDQRPPLFPRTAVSTKPGSEGEASGLYIAFIRAVLAAIRQGLDPQFLASNPSIARDLALGTDAIRARVRRLGLTEAIDRRAAARRAALSAA